jgi:hypothetical protein
MIGAPYGEPSARGNYVTFNATCAESDGAATNQLAAHRELRASETLGPGGRGTGEVRARNSAGRSNRSALESTRGGMRKAMCYEHMDHLDIERIKVLQCARRVWRMENPKMRLEKGRAEAVQSAVDERQMRK